MRPVLLADIEMAVRVLLPLDVSERRDAAAAMISAGRLGDHYRKRFGRPHSDYGGGTLMSAASRYTKAPRPTAWSGDTLICLHILTTQLIEAENHQKP